MATLDASAFDKGLKILYPKGLEYEWQKEASPAVVWVPKAQDFAGKQWNINPVVGAVRGSHSFASALLDKSAPTFEEFHVTRVSDYAIVSVAAEMIAASKSDVGALRQAIQVQTDAAMAEMARARSADIWHNGGGAIGRIATSGISTTVITLASLDDLVRFDVGMRLELSANDGTSGSVRPGSPGYVTVSAIDYDAGTITCTANVTGAISGATDADYIFRKGDFGAAISGFFAWIPASAPTSTPFFGVDRTTHINKLAGSRLPLNGANMEDGIIEAVARMSRYGGKPDTLWMNPLKLGELEKSMQSKTYVEVKTDNPSISFSALQVRSGEGMIKVLSDPHCPESVGLLTRRDSWLLRTLGADPHFAKEDGLQWRTEGSADAVEARLRSWGNLGCLKPINSMHLTW